MGATLFGETEARYAALSGLVHGARVLDLATHTDHRAIDALVTAGATSVTVAAPESVRRELTTHHVDLQLVAPLTLPLSFPPSSFDVVVCFDLIARIAQDPGWMGSLREVLTPDGAIVVATSSADEATRVLGPSFGVATVFAQSPLVGHMLYDIAAHELEPELDRTWAEGADDEPSSYLVIFAPDERHNEKLTLVQMPFASWAHVAGAELGQVREERDHLRHELTTANEGYTRSQWELGAASNELATARTDLANTRSELEVAVSELTSLRREVEQLRITGPVSGDVGEELVRQRSDRASLEAQLADMLQESATTTERLLAWQAQRESIELELVTERARVAELATELGLARQLGTDLEVELGLERQRGTELEAAVIDREVRINQAMARHAELEAAVTERDERIADLELAITELEKSLSERVSPADYEAAQQNAAVAELQDTLALERSAAHQAKVAADSEREVAKRRIDELQRALDLSRRRGDDLARSLDSDRQQLAELKDGLENERRRAEQLKKELDASSSKENDPPTGQKAIDGKS